MNEYVWIMGANGKPTNQYLSILPDDPLARPYPKTTWRIVNGKPVQEFISDLPDDPLIIPYPKTVWRIDPLTNDGKPYHEFLPDIVTLSLHKVFQNEYITIYDRLSDIENFDTHGLAVLSPIRCEVTEEYNGAWTLTIEHPIDIDNKWQYIRPFNIIKALGQLFVIQVVEESYPGTINAKADHIFYQQNDWWINNTAFIPVPVLITVERALTRIKNFLQKYISADQKEYEFYSASDLPLPESFINSIRTRQEGMSLGEYIMGDGNVLHSSGGELYRDNFYYSIYKRMEKSNDNAFEIRIGKDLTGIKRTWDVSTMCTYFTGYDNYGNIYAVSWSEDSAALAAPHGIVRSKNYSFTFPDNLKMSWEEQSEAALGMLKAEVQKFFSETCAPLVSYEVNIKDINKNSDFKEFSNMPDYRVGNIGVIYDEKFGGSIRLKITKTVKNAVTGETSKVYFGDNRSFVGGSYNTAIIDLEQVPQFIGWQLRDSSYALLFDSERNPILYKGV